MTTNAKRTRIATFLFLWLLKTETHFTTGCLSATEPALFEWSRSKCPFRFSFLTEVPQTGHFSVSNATPRFGLSPKKSIGYVASLKHLPRNFQSPRTPGRQSTPLMLYERQKGRQKDYTSSISIKTSSGARILMSRFKKRSFGSTSMRRLCILISHLSKVFVPWPAGDFRVGTISFLVGRGIGPFSLTPVLSAISLISAHIVLISWGSVLDSRILALETIPGYLHDSTFLAESTARPCTVKNIGILRATMIQSGQVLVDENSRYAILEQMTKIRLPKNMEMGNRVGF